MGAPPAPPLQPALSTAPPAPDAHLNAIAAAGARRMHKQHVGTVVEEVESAGGTKALKKVNRAKLLLNKRKNQKQDTPLEHIRLKKMEMELRHKEKMGRAMKKIKVMSMMRKLGVENGGSLTAPPLRSANVATTQTSANANVLSKGEMTKRLSKKALERHLKKQLPAAKEAVPRSEQ